MLFLEHYEVVGRRNRGGSLEKFNLIKLSGGPSENKSNGSRYYQEQSRIYFFNSALGSVVQLISTAAGTAGAETRLFKNTLTNQEGMIDVGPAKDT